MVRRFALFGAVILAACGGNPAAPPPPPTITGSWALTYSVTSAVYMETCQVQGTLTLVQTGAQVSGTGTETGVCSTLTGSFPFSDGFNVAGTFVDPIATLATNGGCFLTGTLSKDTKELDGTATCQSFSGTWQAIR